MSEQLKSTIASKRVRKMAREPSVAANEDRNEVAAGEHEGSASGAAGAVPKPNPLTKTRLILDLLRRDEGVTLAQLVAATGWLPHTTRAALTGIKRKGHALSSEKLDGVRTYRIAAGTPSL